MPQVVTPKAPGYVFEPNQFVDEAVINVGAAAVVVAAASDRRTHLALYSTGTEAVWITIEGTPAVGKGVQLLPGDSLDLQLIRHGPRVVLIHRAIAAAAGGRVTVVETRWAPP